MSARSPLEKLMFFIFCAGFLWLGGVMANEQAGRFRRNMALDRAGAHAQGKVVDYKSTTGKNRQLWPVVTFTTPEGEAVTFESQSRSRISGYAMGATVPVLYDPRTPAVAEINEPDRMWGGMVLQGVISACLACLGGGGMLLLLFKGRGDS